MKSVAQVIGLAGSLLLLVVVFLSGVTTITLLQLGETSRRLAEENLEEQRLLNQFQIVMNDAVIRAAAYARSSQRGALQDARDALGEARDLLPGLTALAARNDRDGFGADRQRQRGALVDEAAAQLNRLSTAIDGGDVATAGLALQRLDLVAQDTATLSRIDTGLLDQQTRGLVLNQQRQFLQGLASTIGVGVLLAAAILVTVVVSHRQLARPLAALETVVQAVGAGAFDRRVAVRQGFELGRLQAGVNAMAESLAQQQHALAERAAALERLNAEQGRLLETINALGAPLLPVQNDVLVLPVVGHVDQARADQIASRVLGQVYERRARVVVLDLTGMALLDERPLAHLLRLRDALALLGAQTVFAGVSAAAAQRLAGSSERLADIRSYRSLGDALAAAAAERPDVAYER